MARGRSSRVTVYDRLESAIRELNDRLGGLPSPKEADCIWSDIWCLEAHHSTALEGNTLVLREVEALLEDGRAVGAKPLREYMEVQGYGAAAQCAYGQALEPGGWSTEGVISMYEVRQVHHRAMSPVWAVAPHPEATDAAAPGNFREHEIQPFQGGITPRFWPLVPAAIEEWVRFVNTHTEELRSRQVPVPWPERLAEVHNCFEKVPPFLDGNGRAGRLLLNLILVRLGYPR